MQINGNSVANFDSPEAVTRDMEQKLYLAAGCFWGAGHFFKKLPGVRAVRVGFANGLTPNPTYQEVYTDTTGYAETVEVTFDPDKIPVRALIQLYFGIIDPTSLNRQGEDAGTRYRTGVYYTDAADLPAIQAVFDEEQALWEKPLQVELEPLRNFFPAEEYHQDYLLKNPDGYCHLPLKVFRYASLLSTVDSLIEGERDTVAVLSNVAALIQEQTGFFWTGFYLVKPSLREETETELVLGPFQGSVACYRIGYGKGVCGTAWARGKSVVVEDVAQFPGHIACSSLSRSEIVVPMRDAQNRIWGVLDIDDTATGTFDDTDRRFLEMLVSRLTAVAP